LNYQEKVSTRADVRALFEKVKANPAVAQYRGYTESKSYGWDEAADDYVKSEGEVWFDNPAFDADFVESHEAIGQEAELLDEKLQASEQTVLALESECARLRAALEAANAEVANAQLARDEAIVGKNAACAIICNLREVLEKVLSYKAD